MAELADPAVGFDCVCMGGKFWRKDPSQGNPKIKNSTDLGHYFGGRDTNSGTQEPGGSAPTTWKLGGAPPTLDCQCRSFLFLFVCVPT